MEEILSRLTKKKADQQFRHLKLHATKPTSCGLKSLQIMVIYYQLLVVRVLAILTLTAVVLPAVAIQQETSPEDYRYCKTKPGNQQGEFDCSNLKLTKIPTFLPPSTVALDLSNNWIQNPYSKSLLHLPKLRKLNLGNNNIVNISGESFKHLENLEELDLSHNNIWSIPSGTFMNLKQLKILRITTSDDWPHKKIMLEPHSLAGLSKLLTLDMSNYAVLLTGFGGDFLNTQLEYSSNKPPTQYLFRDLSSLQTLRMQMTLDCPAANRYIYPRNLTYLDLSFSYLPNLCDFSNIALRGSKHVKQLHLNLSHSQIYYIDSSAFTGIHNIVFLNLSNNLLERLEWYFSNHLRKLQYLEISRNRLYYIHYSALKALSNLTQLNLAGNFISKITSHIFRALSKLVSLDLSNNQLKSLSLSRRLAKLKYLDLSGNAIENIGSDTFQALSTLQHLDLSKNRINNIAPHTFKELRWLVYFHISSEHMNVTHNNPSQDDQSHDKNAVESVEYDLFYPRRSLEDWLSRFDQDYVMWLSQFIGPRLDNVQTVSVQRKFVRTVNDEIHTYYSLNLFKVPKLITVRTSPWTKVERHSWWLTSARKVVLDSVIITMPHYAMPQCADSERYIRISSLHYRGFDETVHDVFSCFVDLKSLYLNNSLPALTWLHSDTFVSLHSLEILDLSNNEFSDIDTSMFCVLDNLKELNLAGNLLRELDPCSHCLLSLNILDLRDNPIILAYYSGKAKESYHRGSSIDFIGVVPVHCTFDGTSFEIHFDLDSLHILHLTDNHGTISFTKCSTPNLVTLDMSNTYIQFSDGKHYFPSMTHMTARIIESPDPVKLVVPSLTNLDISHSSLIMNVHKAFFSETNNLMYVDLSFTAFNDIACASQAHVFFDNFTSLEYLNISHSGVMTLCDFYFKKLPMLTSLDASNNEISSISRHLFDHNKHLTLIDLSNNAIFRLELSTFSKLTNLVKLYFENNPFDCTYLSEMQDFMKSSINVSFTRDGSLPWQTYQCAVPHNIRGKPLLMVNLTDYTNSYAYIVIPVILLGIFALTFLRRRKRDMRMLKQRPYYQQNHLIGEEKDLRYDAFVCFSSEDSDWVYEYLVPTLEETDPPLKLCIHDRDFELGKGILDNIEDEMERSQKFVFVVSKNFVKSKWCDHEMKCAFDKCMLPDSEYGRLIFLILEQVPEDEMSNMLKCHINTTTYLEFPRKNREESLWKRTMKTLLKEQWWPSWVTINEEEHFWRKLKQTLQKKEKIH